MSDFNAEEAGRLAKEFAEDATTLLGDDYNAWMDASQRCRSNVRSAAEQLRGAVAEVERLRARNCEACGTMAICVEKTAADRDSLRTRLAEVTGLCEEACRIADANAFQRGLIGSSSDHRALLKAQADENDMRVTAIRAALAKKETL